MTPEEREELMSKLDDAPGDQILEAMIVVAVMTMDKANEDKARDILKAALEAHRHCVCLALMDRLTRDKPTANGLVSRVNALGDEMYDRLDQSTSRFLSLAGMLKNG